MRSGLNRYRYNGMELNEELGLYDYGARWYDPAVARWGQIDPLADEYAPVSPYNYVLNNPLIFIDPDGRDAILAINRQSRTVTVRADLFWSKDSKTQFDNRGFSNTFTQNSGAVNGLSNVWEGREFTTEIDGETYAVNFDVNIVETDTHDEAVELAKGAGGNLLLARESGGSSSYGNGVLSLNLSQRGIGRDGKTFSHELGHAFGLEHLDATPQSGGVASIMSYDYPRDVKDSDVNSIISTAIDISNRSDASSTSFRVDTDKDGTRFLTIISQQ